MKPLTALAAALFAAIALLFTSPPASATFPGENGRLALVWTYEPDVTTDVILTAGATSGVRIDDVTVCDYGCHNDSPDWSPNGRRLAFVLERFEDDLPRLVTTRADGSDLELVYEPPTGAGLSDVAWSPGGDRIAFTRHWFSKLGHFVSDVYVVRRSGNHLMRLSHTPRRWEAELDWSSENRLVFRSQHGPSLKKRSELFTMRPTVGGFIG
jgi:Tol biopolymer transport system component